MRVSAFLAKLRDRNIHVWADGDRLRCNGPAGLLTPDLRDQLQQLKGDILEFLRSAEALARQLRDIVPLQPNGTRTPVFGVPGHNGDVFCFRALVQHLDADQPFFGLQPPGLEDGREPLQRIEQLAAYFAAQIRAFRPGGPYIIAGHCAGGMTAFELARQLQQEGAPIGLVVLFGAPYPTRFRRLTFLRARLERQAEWVVRHTRALAALSFGEWPLYFREKLRSRKADRAAELAAERAAGVDREYILRRARLERATIAAGGRYVPGQFKGRVCLILPNKGWARSIDEPLRWTALATDAEIYYGPDSVNRDNTNMLLEPSAPAFAELFRLCRDGTLGEDRGRFQIPREL
jgi:thioesterase domain-containing protein